MPKGQIIYIQPEAPAKPALGQVCNGCGVCCLLEPCPVGVLVSRRRSGACAAVMWSAEQERYLCGMVAAPGRFLPWSWRWLNAAVSRWARRVIAAGVGCDADIDAQVLPAGRPEAADKEF